MSLDCKTTCHENGLVIAWWYLALLQIVTQRYLKPFWYLNIWIHILSGSAMVFLTFFFVLYMYKLKDGYVKDSKYPHPLIGTTIMSLCGFLIIGGVFAKVVKNKIKWNSRLILNIKLGHKLLAWTLILLAQVQIYFGYKYTRDKYKGIYSGAMFIGIVFGLEIIY